MTDEFCDASIEPRDGHVLTCGLPADHDGPVHDDDGEQWGDPELLAHPGA